MADNEVTVTDATEAAGTANIDTESLTISSKTVHRQRIQLAGSGASQIASVQSTSPDGTEQALVTRNIPSGTQNVAVASALPAGSSNIGDVDIASLPNEGQQTMANSISVAMASDQSALPVKTATGDEVAVRKTVMAPLDDSGSAVTIKYARINATADGDNTIISGVSLKKIRILGISFTVTGAGTITLQDTNASPEIFATYSLATNGGLVFVGSNEVPFLETATGEGFEINNPAGIDTLGRCTYIEV